MASRMIVNLLVLSASRLAISLTDGRRGVSDVTGIVVMLVITLLVAGIIGLFVLQVDS